MARLPYATTAQFEELMRQSRLLPHDQQLDDIAGRRGGSPIRTKDSETGPQLTAVSGARS